MRDHVPLQEACRSWVPAGVALSQYLSKIDKSAYKRFKPSSILEGLPGSLDPMLWVYFLNGTFANAPSLRPEEALLLPFSDGADLDDRIECLLHWQSARAFAQAEETFEAAVPGATERHCVPDGVQCFSVADQVHACLFVRFCCSNSRAVL